MELMVGLGAICEASQSFSRSLFALMWIELAGVLLGGTLLWLTLKCLSNIRLLGAIQAENQGNESL